MKLQVLLQILGLCLVIQFAHAQLTIGSQIRPRGEFRNGFKTLDSDQRDPAFFIEQRSRLSVNYNSGKFETNLVLQDIRMWGATNQIYKSDPSLTNVYEAWGKYRLNDLWAFKIGRQALDYNNARFFGNLDWAAQGRSHDALLLTYQNDSADFRLDLGGAFNQDGFEPAKLFETDYFLSNYKTMQFAWADKKFDRSRISLLIQNDGRQSQVDSSTVFRQTYGLVGMVNLGDLIFDGELYYQGGQNASEQDINAYLISLNATLKTDLTPVTLGFDYISGTSINDDKDHSFSPLYGTNHKFYGFMDYFYVGNFHGQQGNVAGLFDAYLKTKFKLTKSSSLLTHLHAFSSAADLYDTENTDTAIDKYLGTEIDLVYTLKMDKNVSLNLGYSQMFASTSMEQVKSLPGDASNLNNWVWFMINFNPVIFTTAK